MILNNEISVIGRFNKPHGINGEISATFDYPLDFDTLRYIIAEIDGINVPFFVESCRPKNQNTVLLKFEGFENEIQVNELSNKDILLKKTDIPEFDADDDGMYASDLIGYSIIADNQTIGKVIDIDDNTENVLFIVEGISANKIFIPVVDEFIVEIDSENFTITMDLPNGILDLN